MREHPIENLMKTAMNSIKEMVDVNTIIGNPISTQTGMCIIPVSKVCFGFAAGGTDFSPKTKCNKEDEEEYPFGGGSGAAVKINPIGFIIIDSENLGAPKFIPVEHYDAIDKLLDYVPDLIEKVDKMFDKIIEKNNLDSDNCNDDIDNDEIDDTEKVITHKEIRHED